MVGANCTLAPDAMRPVVTELLAAATVPVLVQPNAGQPVPDAAGRPTYATDPDEIATAAARWVTDGVAVVGGCCGTTPEHLRKMRAALEAHTVGETPTLEEIATRLGGFSSTDDGTGEAPSRATRGSRRRRRS